MMNQDAPFYTLLRSVNDPAALGASLFYGSLKVLMLFGLACFIVLGLVVVRQIAQMSKTVETSLGPVLTIIGFAYFIATVSIFVLGLLVL